MDFSSTVELADSLNAAVAGGAGGTNLLMIVFLVLAIIVLFILPARRQKKMQAELKQRQDSMAPGTEVMTNFGLFGTVAEVNKEENYALLKTHSAGVVKVHLQTVTTLVEKTENSGDGSAPVQEPVQEPAQEREQGQVYRPGSEESGR